MLTVSNLFFRVVSFHMKKSRRSVLLSAVSTATMFSAGCVGRRSSPPRIRVISVDMKELTRFPQTVTPTVYEKPERKLITITGIESDTLSCPDLTWDVSPVGEQIDELRVSTNVVNRSSCADDEVSVEMFPYRFFIWFEELTRGGKIKVETSKDSDVYSINGFRGVTEL